MSVYTYIITRDYGFAPNPFHRMCTLATCKPRIRKSAQIGDWVVGFGSASTKWKNKIIYAMLVEKKVSFDTYWNDPVYKCKKPVVNGSLKQNYGDNIYHKVNGIWVQANSHHSKDDGTTNEYNLKRDTQFDSVLISSTYWYFGKEAVNIPQNLKEIIPSGRGHRIFTGYDEQLLEWLSSLDENGYIGEPAKFEKFERYDGIH